MSEVPEVPTCRLARREPRPASVPATSLGPATHVTPARAQDNAATVQALFDAGKKLMAEGKIGEACPKLLSSYALEKVTRDGVTVDAAVYGVALPVDGGKHVITASAPGKKDWSSEVTLAPTGDHQTLAIPALADAPVAVVAPVASGASGASGV